MEYSDEYNYLDVAFEGKFPSLAELAGRLDPSRRPNLAKHDVPL